MHPPMRLTTMHRECVFLSNLLCEPYRDESRNALAVTGILLPIGVGYFVALALLALVGYCMVGGFKRAMSGDRFDIALTAATPDTWTAVSARMPLFDCVGARIELTDHGSTRLGGAMSEREALALAETLRTVGGAARVVRPV